MKKKQWQKAGNFLRRAKKLPASLSSSRRKLLRTIEDREKEERQGQVGQQYQSMPSLPPPPPMAFIPYAPGLPPGPDGKPAEVGGFDPKKDKKKAPPPAPPKTGLSFTATPAMNYIGLQKTDDSHGYKTVVTNGGTKEFTLALMMRYDGKPRDFGGQPAFTFPVNLGRYSSEIKSKSTKYSAFEDAPDTVFTEETESEGATLTISTDGASSRTYSTGETWEYTLLPTGFIPVTESVDIEVKYLFKESYPHMHADQKTGTRGPSGKLVVEFGSTTLTGTVGSTDTVNTKGDPVRNDLALGAELAKTWETATGKLSVSHVDSAVPGEFPKIGPQGVDSVSGTLTKNFESLAVTGTLKQTSNTPFKEIPLAGAASATRVELNAKMSFDWFSFSGTGSITQLGGYQVTGIDHPTAVDADNKPQKVEAGADGTATNWLVVAKATPFDWIWASLIYSSTTSDFQIKDPELDTKFKTSTVNKSSQFTYAVGVSRSF